MQRGDTRTILSTIIHRSLKANITSRAAAAPPPPPPPPQKMSLPFLLLRLHTRKGPRFTKDHKVGAKKVLRRTVLCSQDFEKEPRGQYWALKGEGRDRAFEQRDPFWRERGVTQPPPKKNVRTCDKSSTFFRRVGEGGRRRGKTCVSALLSIIESTAEGEMGGDRNRYPSLREGKNGGGDIERQKKKVKQTLRVERNKSERAIPDDSLLFPFGI